MVVRITEKKEIKMYMERCNIDYYSTVLQMIHHIHVYSGNKLPFVCKKLEKEIAYANKPKEIGSVRVTPLSEELKELLSKEISA